MAVALLLAGAPAQLGAGPRDSPASGGPTARTVEYQCDGGQRLSVTFEGETARLVDPAGRYAMELSAEGRVAMRLDCNRGTERWSATATSSTGGSLTLGPLGVTRAACPSPLGNRVAADVPRVRSYTLKGDTLNLALVADAGVYTWRRVEK
jgi:para-nitrobenzyl esterase